MTDKSHTPHLSKRKHGLGDEPDFSGGTRKRIRLDTLLKNLSLDDHKIAVPKGARFRVNPLLGSTDPDDSKKKRTRIDEIINERIIDEYNTKMLEGLVLIKWEQPLFVIMKHFHLWVKRLFNNFVKEYNRSNPGRKPVPRFRDYRKIIALVSDPSVLLTWTDLWNIIKRQNASERRNLEFKKDKRLDSSKLQEIRDEEDIAKDCKYTYWDRFASVPQDMDMDAVDGSDPLSDMEVDESGPTIIYPSSSPEAIYV